MTGQKYTYNAVLNYSNDDQGYIITFPDFQGAHTFADDYEEALYNAREVLEIYTIMYEDKGKELPQPTAYKQLFEYLQVEEDRIVSINVDTALIRDKEQNKAITKSVTLPKWLLELGKKEKVNFSQVLQEALRKQLNV